MKKHRRKDHRSDRETCPKCKSTEIKLRGGRFRILLGRIRRKHHYSCRRCLIYWSSSRFDNTRAREVSGRWYASSLDRWSGRLGCFVGYHCFGDLRKNPEGGKMRSCRRCNIHQNV